MSYISDTMQSGEEIMIEPKLHWINYSNPILVVIGAIILGMSEWVVGIRDHGFLFISAMMLVYAGYKILYLKCMEMAVTNKRVVLRKGIVASDGDEMRNSAITGIEVEQVVMGRILNYGNVCFTSAGSGGRTLVVFPAVRDPRRLKAWIEDAMDGIRHENNNNDNNNNF